MLALHLCAAPAWPFSSSSKPAPTPTPTSATSALEASCKEHTERYHKYEWLGDCPEPRDKPLLLISPSDHKRKSNSIEFVYQKPLKRP